MKEETILLNRKKKSEIPQPVPKGAKGKKMAVRGALAAVVVVIVGAVLLLGLSGKKEEFAQGSTYMVTRADLPITVIEAGSLKAKRSVEIESQVEGQATIIKIIPEGTFVKKGDVLVELDSADLEERRTQQEISYEGANASLISARENLEIQKKQNESDIMAGVLKVEFAEKDLKKYLEGDWPQEIRKMENTIKLAEEELKRATDRLEWTKKLFEKGFVTQNDKEADELAVIRRGIDLEQAKRQKELAEAYDRPMMERKLKADLEEANLALERIRRRADSEIAQRDADLRSKDAQFKLQEERFKKIKEQIENCVIKAPQDGLVVYGSGSEGGMRFGRSESEIIEEGATVRYRQTIITLPDVSLMQVETKVHESSIDKVELGQEALVTVDAFPDLRLHGKVTKVAILPDSQSRWLNPDLKIYSTDITLDDGNEKLKPGMSAKVEIVIDRLKNVFFVPIQSVYRKGGKEVCYVLSSSGIEARPITVGLNNETFVEVKEGLKEGEQVLLYPPAAMGEAAAEEEGEQEREGAEEVEEKEEGEEREGEREGGERRGERGEENREGLPRSFEEREKREGAQSSPFSREMLEKLKNMSPEERIEFFNKNKEELQRSFFQNRGESDRDPERMNRQRGEPFGEGRRRRPSREGGEGGSDGKEIFSPVKGKEEGEKRGSEKE